MNRYLYTVVKILQGIAARIDAFAGNISRLESQQMLNRQKEERRSGLAKAGTGVVKNGPYLM